MGAIVPLAGWAVIEIYWLYWDRGLFRGKSRGTNEAKKSPPRGGAGFLMSQILGGR